MSSYFIKYENFAIYVCQTSKLISSYSYTVIPIAGQMDYEYKRLRYPYANCIRMDLREQLFGKNLQKTLPKKIMSEVCNLVEVKSLIRDEKIDRLLSGK
jgi:hypothetical protein